MAAGGGDMRALQCGREVMELLGGGGVCAGPQIRLLCHCRQETHLHMMATCSYAKPIWRHVQLSHNEQGRADLCNHERVRVKGTDMGFIACVCPVGCTSWHICRH